jgi:hypothetical protein
MPGAREGSDEDRVAHENVGDPARPKRRVARRRRGALDQGGRLRQSRQGRRHVVQPSAEDCDLFNEAGDAIPNATVDH